LEFADEECGIAVELLSKSFRISFCSRAFGFNPPEHQDRFISKYKKVWLEGTFLIAETEREHMDANGFFKKHLKKQRERSA